MSNDYYNRELTNKIRSSITDNCFHSVPSNIVLTMCENIDLLHCLLDVKDAQIENLKEEIASIGKYIKSSYDDKDFANEAYEIAKNAYHNACECGCIHMNYDVGVLNEYFGEEQP